jgi:hippurate hydrolase
VLINLFHEDMTAWRRDLHAHPEFGFEEHHASEFVAGKLAEFGCEVHRNIGKTGVVGVLRTGNGSSVGLRADMRSADREKLARMNQNRRYAPHRSAPSR